MLHNLDNDGYGYVSRFPLNIRPEDLTITEPSRQVVQQTLGGAWLDDFGEGVANVQLAGHTGWRGIKDADGMALFTVLHTQVFKRWHQLRQEAIDDGKDPGNVKLILADDLDERVYIVAPMTFTLRRSKSRPLLVQYQIALNVLSKDAASERKKVDDALAEGENPATQEQAKTTLQRVLSTLASITATLLKAASAVQAFIGNLLGPVIAFVDTVTTIIAAVGTIAAAVKTLVTSVVGPLMQLATSLTRAGTQLARTISQIAHLPQDIKHAFMQMAAAFHNAYCVMKNAFKVSKELPDYSDVYGSSTCSSTTGGRPASPLYGQNVFSYTNPVVTPLFSTQPEAVRAIASLGNLDPVLAPQDPQALAGDIQAAASGITVPDNIASVVATASAAVGTFSRRLTGGRFVPIMAGDTLQTIAARELNDAAAWPQLIALNSLVPPYVADTRAPGVLQYGDLILVPATTSTVSVTTTPEEVFLTDALLANGELRLSDGDFAVVGGRDNLAQALSNRVTTEKRDILYHLDYGCWARRIIGDGNSPADALVGAEYVRAALLEDPRVSQIASTKATIVGDRLEIVAEVIPVAGRPLTIQETL